MRPRRFEREIEGLSVSLEGYDWEGCTFKNCEILVSEGNFSLINDSFVGCRLTLSGKAAGIGKVIELFSQGKPLNLVEGGKSE